MNDIEDLVHAQRSGCVQPRLRFLEGWRIYRLAREASARLPFARSTRRSGEPTTEECRSMSIEYRNQLLEVARALRADGRRFLFVQMEPFGCSGFGDLVWAQYNSVWAEYEANLRRALADVDADFVDVTQELRTPGRTLRPADTHPNAVAHAALAERIAEKVDDAGALAHCRAPETVP